MSSCHIVAKPLPRHVIGDELDDELDMKLRPPDQHSSLLEVEKITNVEIYLWDN